MHDLSEPRPGDEPELSPEEMTLLRMRAKRYARAAIEQQSGDAEIVAFRRGSVRYALTLAELREVRPLRTLSVIPGANPCVLGILHFRGEILSVHDIGAFMSGGSEVSEGAWVIVVESEGERLGLLADEILGIETYTPNAISPIPISFGERGAICEGMLPAGELLLSAQKLFRCDELFFAF